MFIRVKKVKKGEKVYEYAHLVSGEWRKRRVRLVTAGTNRGKGSKKEVRKFNNSVHKYHGLVGRVYRFTEKDKKVNHTAHFENALNSGKIEEVYKSLVQKELESRNFVLDKGIYFRDGLFVDLNRLMVHDGRGDVVLKLSEHSGYFCTHTLRELFAINKIQGRSEGMYFMRKLKQTGLDVKPEEFFKIASMMLEKKE
jgi:hypothetical protein